MQWKAAGQPALLDESADITRFMWKIRDSIPASVIAQGDIGPPLMVGGSSCQCRVYDNKCSRDICNIFRACLTAIIMAKRDAATSTLRDSGRCRN